MTSTLHLYANPKRFFLRFSSSSLAVIVYTRPLIGTNQDEFTFHSKASDMKKTEARLTISSLLEKPLSSSIGKASLLALFFAIVLILLNFMNYLNESSNEAISSLNDSILNRKMREDGFALVAIKGTASYEGECQDNENRIVDRGQYNERFFVFCRIWSPDEFPDLHAD